jgi:nitrogen regulatory protein P-II 1
MEKNLISEIMEKISTGSAGDGKIFVKDVTGAYDIGSKESGDKAAL